MSARVAAFGRMGVGALVLWGFLALTGQAQGALALTGTQWVWVMITSAFLLAYVWTWYAALKAAPATLVTSILTVGAVITLLLAAVVEGKPVTAVQAGAMALLALGVVAYVFRLPEGRQAAPEAGSSHAGGAG